LESVGVSGSIAGLTCAGRESQARQPTEERGFNLAVELDVTLPSVDDPEAAVE
jgi:hypothetical protein